MRLARLLLLALFVLAMGEITVGQESKTDNQKPGVQQHDVKPLPPDFAKSLDSLQDGQTYTYHGVPFRLDKKNLRLVPDLNALNAVTNDCLVIHTIQVARDEKDSDSTHVVNVTNCTPAKRFQMKSAVATPQQK